MVDEQRRRLAHATAEALKQGHLDDADRVCQRLRADFPDTIDWLDRSALVAEARGDLPRAAEFFRRAADFAEANDGFEPDGIAWFRQRATELNARSSQLAS